MKFQCENCGKVDYALLDGYNVGDRLLEGVMFEIRCINNNIYQAQVTKDCAEYFEDLNKQKWIKAMEEYAAETDVFECPECGEDIYDGQISISIRRYRRLSPVYR